MTGSGLAVCSVDCMAGSWHSAHMELPLCMGVAACLAEHMAPLHLDWMELPFRMHCMVGCKAGRNSACMEVPQVRRVVHLAAIQLLAWEHVGDVILSSDPSDSSQTSSQDSCCLGFGHQHPDCTHPRSFVAMYHQKNTLPSRRSHSFASTPSRWFLEGSRSPPVQNH